MYSLDNIYKSFDNNQVLKGVSLEIPKNKTPRPDRAIRFRQDNIAALY